jgi:hypothetical protein
MRRLAGDEMIVGDVEGVRPGQPGAAAGEVPLAGEGAQRAGLVEVAGERGVELVTVPIFRRRRWSGHFSPAVSDFVEVGQPRAPPETYSLAAPPLRTRT